MSAISCHTIVATPSITLYMFYIYYRNYSNIRLPKTTQYYFLKSFILSSTRPWNNLDIILDLTDLDAFRTGLKTDYLNHPTSHIYRNSPKSSYTHVG